MPLNDPVPSTAADVLKRNVQDFDRFVVSSENTFVNRLGVEKLTVTGIISTANEAIANIQADGQSALDALRVVNAGSFEDGGTITVRPEVLFFDAEKTYYRWDGDLPKTVPAGSTPATTGGVGDGAWVNVGQAELASALADEADSANRVARMAITADSLKDLVNAPRITNRQYSVKGFYAGSDVGGGMFYWDATRDKADHNGGTVIDPVRVAAWDGTYGDLSTLFTAEVSGSGCFVRIVTTIYFDPAWFGALTNHNIAKSLKAMANLSPIKLGNGSYGIEERVEFGDNIVFIGSGKDTVLVKQDSTMNINGLVFGDNCVWGNFTLDGNFRNFSNKAGNDITIGAFASPGKNNYARQIWAVDSESSHIASSRGAGTVVEWFDGEDYLDHAIYFSTDCKGVQLNHIKTQSTVGREAIKFRRNIADVIVSNFDIKCPTYAFSFQQEDGNNYGGDVLISDGKADCKYFCVASANTGVINEMGTLFIDNVRVKGNTDVSSGLDIRAIVSKGGGDLDGFSSVVVTNSRCLNVDPYPTILTLDASDNDRQTVEKLYEVRDTKFKLTTGQTLGGSVSYGYFPSIPDRIVKAKLAFTDVSISDNIRTDIRAYNNLTISVQNSVGVGGAYGVDVRDTVDSIVYKDNELAKSNTISIIAMNNLPEGKLIPLLDISGTKINGLANYGEIRSYDPDKVGVLNNAGVVLLQANQKPSGSTLERPTFANLHTPGFVYFDTDLGKPIYYAGNGNWVDATGAPA